jgi:hypothetical protein
MAEYHFVSTWQLQAPVERVWEEIWQAERWPLWWKYVAGVQEVEPGAADGTGRRLRLRFRTRLAYMLAFDVRLTCVQPPSSPEAAAKLEARSAGELEGAGCWTLTPAGGGTQVRYTWDVRTTRWWMNLLAPAARPAFRWNHDQLMRAGGEGLARRLGTELAMGTELAPPAARPRPCQRAWAARWVIAAAALAGAGVLGWRRLTAAR